MSTTTTPVEEPTTANEAETQDTELLSKDKVNEIVQNVHSRVTKKYQDEIDSLKVKASKYDELEQAKKSELEKANEASSKYKSELDAALARIADLEQGSNVSAIATKLGAINASQVYALVKDQLTADADTEQVVKSFLDENPHFVRSEASTPPPTVPVVASLSKQGSKEIFSKEELAQFSAEDYMRDPELLRKAKASREWHSRNS